MAENKDLPPIPNHEGVSIPVTPLAEVKEKPAEPLSWKRIGEMYGILPAPSRAETQAVKRKEKASQYLEELQKNGKNYHPVTVEQEMTVRHQCYQENIAKQKPVDRLKRKVTVAYLTLRGIKNADQLVSLVEESELRYKDRDANQIHNVVNEYRDLREVVPALKKLKDPVKAMSRLLSFSHDASIYWLNNPEQDILSVLKQLEDIPEETFQKAVKELNQARNTFEFNLADWYPVSQEYPQEYQRQCFYSIFEIMKRGGFTPEQKAALAELGKIEALKLKDDYDPISNLYKKPSSEKIISQEDRDLVDLDKTRISQRRIIIEELVTEVFLSTEANKKQFNLESAKNLIEALHRGSTETSLPLLTQLINEGWQIYNSGKLSESNYIRDEYRDARDIETNIQNWQTTGAKDKLSMADLEVISYLFRKDISLDNISFFIRVLNEEPYLLNLARVCLNVEKNNPEKARAIFNSFLLVSYDKQSKKYSFKLGTNNCWETLCDNIDFESLTPDEKVFWTLFKEIRSRVYGSEGGENLLSFLFKNQNRISEGKITQEILNEYLNYEGTVLNGTILKAFFANTPEGEITSETWKIIKTNVENNSNVIPIGFARFLFNKEHQNKNINDFFVDGKITLGGLQEFLSSEVDESQKIATLSFLFDTKSQLISNLVTLSNLEFTIDNSSTQFWESPLGKLLISHPDKWSIYFKDGKTQPELVKDYFDQGEFNYKNLLWILQYPETLSSFPKENQSYWLLWVNLSSIPLSEFLFNERSLFKDNSFNEEGKITFETFQQIIERIQHLEPDTANVFFQYSDPVRELLATTDLSKLSTIDRSYWEFVADCTGVLQEILIKEPEFITNEFFTPKGKLKSEKIKGLINQLNSKGLIREAKYFLARTDFSDLPKSQQDYWNFVATCQLDLQNYLLSTTDADITYTKGDNFNRATAESDFYKLAKLQPERIRTYEGLSQIFIEINSIIDFEVRALTFLRIAEAIQVVRMTDRSQVEATQQLARSFASLYRPNMAPFERQCWRLLQKELPFTANERVRESMRNQALIVEALNNQRLGWVHQSVHNYASTRVPNYLRAFKTFITDGNSRELLRIREFFGGDSRAPDYTKAERQELQRILPDLNALIYFASEFYEIKPERLGSAIEDVQPVLRKYDGLETELSTLKTAVDIVNEPGEINAVKYLEIVKFCRTVNSARKKITNAVVAEDVERKSRLLVLDSVLSNLSQQMFTQYTDYLKEHLEKGEQFSPNEVYQAVSILHQMFQASFIEGENPSALELDQPIKDLEKFDQPLNISPAAIHKARISLQYLNQVAMNSDWGKFIQVAQPEMVDMLIRMGVSREEALERVYATDLVNYRKKSMSFVIEPVIRIVEQMLEKIDTGNLSIDTNQTYKDILHEPVLGKTNAEEIDQYLTTKLKDQLPQDLKEASTFLTQISNTSFFRAEKLCRIFLSEFIDKNSSLENKPMSFETDKGEVVNIYPFTYYGLEGVVITLNGQILDDPEAFLIQRFKPVQAQLHSLREGD